VSFDGIDDWVTVADSNSLDVVNDMTLEAWVKPASVAPWRTLMAKEHTDGHVWALYAPGGSGNAHSEIGVFGLGSPNRCPPTSGRTSR